jgi:hypothetical protein
MYGSEASIRLSPGISTPSNRGMLIFRARQMAFSVATGHPCGSALSLFVPWVFTNHTEHILSFYNPAALTEPLYRRSHFHPNSSSGDKKTPPEEILSQERFSLKIISLLPEGYPALRQIVGGHLYHNFISWQDPNEMQSHFSRDMRQNPVSVG